MTPEMLDELNRFRKRAAALGVPSADVERWLTATRRCATLSPHVDGPVVGRFGGPLMLPADAPDLEKEHHLVASIDLAALPEDATDLPLPPDGRLLLIASFDTSAANSYNSVGDAVYISADTPVEERHAPPEEEPDADEDENPISRERRKRSRARLERPTGELRLRHDVSLPDHDTIIDTARHPYAEELRTAWREKWRDHLPDTPEWAEVTEDDVSDEVLDSGSPECPRVQIGGYAMDMERNFDPVTDSAHWAARSEEEGLRPRSARLSRPEDWVLLAQWATDLYGLEDAEYHWAITRQDLAARRFDRGHVSMLFAP